MRVVWSPARCIFGLPGTSIAVAACRAEGNGSAFLGIHDERGVSAFEEAVGRRPVSFTNAHAQALPAKLGVESFSRIDAAKLCSYDPRFFTKTISRGSTRKAAGS
jgi:hypothetical protein